MEPRGICIEERVRIVFPDGKTKDGSIWQLTEGSDNLYAVVSNGAEMAFYALAPVWRVRAHYGRPIYQDISGDGV